MVRAGILTYILAPLRPGRTWRIIGLIVQRQVGGSEIRRFQNAFWFALPVEVNRPPPLILRHLWSKLGRAVRPQFHSIVARNAEKPIPADGKPDQIAARLVGSFQFPQLLDIKRHFWLRRMSFR